MKGPQGNVKKEPQILGGTQRWSSEDETVVEGTPKAQGIKANEHYHGIVGPGKVCKGMDSQLETPS